MIGEHCKNLRYFRIFNFSIRNGTENRFIPLFTRIEELNIKIELGPTLVFLPKINCPKLVAFKWTVHRFVYGDIPALISFLCHNTQLKSFLYGATASFPNMKSIQFFPIPISLFSQFKFLKMLTIFNFNGSLAPLSIEYEQLLGVTQLTQKLSLNNVPIECLKLIDTYIDDDAIEYISQMKNIKKFSFMSSNYYQPNRHIIESYIIQLKSGLPNLEFLLFQTSLCIDIVFTDTDKYNKLIKNTLSNKFGLNETLRTAFRHRFQLDDTFDSKCYSIETENFRGQLQNYELKLKKVDRIFFTGYFYYILK